jgi:hypothetical protein
MQPAAPASAAGLRLDPFAEPVLDRKQGTSLGRNARQRHLARVIYEGLVRTQGPALRDRRLQQQTVTGESRGPETVMLDAYVIEEIKRRERERGRDDRPALDLPLPPPAAPGQGGARDDDRKDDRGVVIIDYSS